jgi:hypothetical protein
MDNVLTVEGLDLKLVTEIHPDRTANGQIAEFMPQSRYKNAGSDPLNSNGEGPFCRFSLRGLPSQSGVYAVTVNGLIVYFGECVDLSARWGLSGYGSIQPKNCYVGGQSTNCKINHRVLLATKDGATVRLWFHPTDDYKAVESSVLNKVRFPWNGKGGA